MNRSIPLLLVVAALVSAGCQTHAVRPTEFVVSLTSATPVTFTGNLKVDGKQQVVVGTTPAEFRIAGNRIDCDLVQGPESGLLTAQIRTGPGEDAPEFVASSGGPNTPLTGTVQPHDFWAWIR